MELEGDENLELDFNLHSLLMLLHALLEIATQLLHSQLVRSHDFFLALMSSLFDLPHAVRHKKEAATPTQAPVSEGLAFTRLTICFC